MNCSARHLVSACLALALGHEWAHAQSCNNSALPIEVTIDGVCQGRYASGAVIEIDLGTQQSYIARNIHIFDRSGVNDSVGAVTVRGQLNGGGLIQVYVADPTIDPFAAFPSRARDFVDPGARNFGGIQFLGPVNNPSNTSLRQAARVSINIVGDVTGDITAGQIHRVDVLRSGDNTFGGTISGNITATARDYATTGTFASIAVNYVRAGWSISGDIKADPVGTYNLNDTNTWGTVNVVTVGPSTSALGIQGDIIAEEGEINRVYTTGNIGVSAAARSQFRAATAVREIIAGAERPEGNPTIPTILDRDFFLDINAALAPDIAPQYATSTEFIQTEGDFVGNLDFIDVYPFFANSQLPEGVGQGTRLGMFVGGKFEGNINVRYSWQYADMIARSFRGNINIGHMLKGSVVAVGTEGSVDPLDGTIGSITVGRGTTSNAPRGNGRGITGVFAGLFSTAGIAPPFEGAARNAWYDRSLIRDYGVADSVIRADKSIGTVSLASISGRLDGLTALAKRAKGRVESPIIGTLVIDQFDDGVVWSGKLNSPTAQVTNLIADDHASIGSASIGCMGPNADLWMSNATNVVVQGDMFGEIHALNLASSQTIKIGGRFGDTAQASEQVAPCFAYFNDGQYEFRLIGNPEDSPRGTWSSVENNAVPGYESVATFSRIVLRQPQSLAGQVILDAANTTGVHRAAGHWRGDVLIGTGQPGNLEQSRTPEVYSTNASRTNTNRLGPIYPELPVSLGGGAIGLVPFAIHRQASELDTDCTFANRSAGAPFYRGFNASPGVNGNGQPCTAARDSLKIVYYGPVAQVQPPAGFFQRPPFEILLAATSSVSCSGTADGSWSTTTTFQDGGRRVEVLGNSGTFFPSGKYGIRELREAWGNTGGLRCTGLLTTTLVRPLDASQYKFFSLAADCNQDCLADTQQTSCPVNPWFACDDIDFNNDSILFDPDDVDAFLSVFSEGPCIPATAVCNDIDFNNDGGLFDICDISSYLLVFSEGPCTPCGQ